MQLEDTLLLLVGEGDGRRLVAALCACAREQLPRAEAINPYNRAVIECAAGWVRGDVTVAEVRKVRRRAGNTRGATFSAACVAAIVDAPATREGTVRLFASQLPAAVWMATSAGQSWASANGPLAPVGRDPAAWAQVVDTDARLAALARAALDAVAKPA